MPSCVVPTCKNACGHQKKQEGITFHLFPADEERKSDWANIIQRARLDELWKPSNRSVVCSIHFDEKYFYATKAGLKRLKKDAIPNKNLAVTLEDSESCRPGPSTTTHVTSLPHRSPSSNSEIGDVNISDSESVFDTPRKIKLKSQLRRKQMLCERYVRRIKTLQQKNKRLAKRNESLKNVLRRLLNKKALD